MAITFEENVEDYKLKTDFMEVVDFNLWWHYFQRRYNTDDLANVNHAMPLHVIRSKGVEVKPDFDLEVTELSPGEWNHKHKMFRDTGDGGITFKIDVVIGNDETWGIDKRSENQRVNESYMSYYGEKFPNKDHVTSWLNWFYLNKRPLNVVTDAIDINNGTYIIVDNPTRKQTLDDYTVWTLEFATYYAWKAYTFDVSASTNKTTTSIATKNTNLFNCELSNFRYQKTPGNYTKCTGWLHEKLYQWGFDSRNRKDDHWYSDETAAAVKKFQEKYMKYYTGIKQANGMMDKATLQAMEWFASQ